MTQLTKLNIWRKQLKFFFFINFLNKIALIYLQRTRNVGKRSLQRNI